MSGVWTYGTSASWDESGPAYSGFMEARATATAWFKIEQKTIYAVALIAVCLLLASVVLAWSAARSRGQERESADERDVTEVDRARIPD